MGKKLGALKLVNNTVKGKRVRKKKRGEMADNCGGNQIKTHSTRSQPNYSNNKKAEEN